MDGYAEIHFICLYQFGYGQARNEKIKGVVCSVNNDAIAIALRVVRGGICHLKHNFGYPFHGGNLKIRNICNRHRHPV